MATFQINGVRTEQSPGATHEHISHVRLAATGTIFPRSTVIKDLRDPYGDRYYTKVGQARANVIVVGCPLCSFGDYIKTEADGTTADNLLSLPRV
jgi:uncharacterized protein DUF3892